MFHVFSLCLVQAYCYLYYALLKYVQFNCLFSRNLASGGQDLMTVFNRSNKMFFVYYRIN